jgi:hypothetical protein
MARDAREHAEAERERGPRGGEWERWRRKTRHPIIIMRRIGLGGRGNDAVGASD